MGMFTKEELENVLKETASKFKHIEPYVILLIYGYIKMKKLEKKKSRLV